ncbi:MAG: hypothetical protein CL877_07190 [Dehalococcoidales bacterium]|jgi:SAM-dependent methyltransferase|nr:hypothetical protein [Dehalococcoidales bacterium]
MSKFNKLPAPIHDLHRQLLEVGACGDGPLTLFHPRVRDRADIEVLRCNDSGVIVLSRIDHIIDSFYTDPLPVSSLTGLDNAIDYQDRLDTSRRIKLLNRSVANRRWLDIGTGPGTLITELEGVPTLSCGVEPNNVYRSMLQSNSHDIRPSIEDFHGCYFDVISLFHVFEHLVDPLDHLNRVRELLIPGGTIFIEIPHANEFLLNCANLVEYRDFTLWSQHLVLHTQRSIVQMLQYSGFNIINLEGIQRYSLENHLYWFKYGLPGGHHVMSDLVEDDLRLSYEETLRRLDSTDTLMVSATVPN